MSWRGEDNQAYVAPLEVNEVNATSVAMLGRLLTRVEDARPLREVAISEVRSLPEQSFGPAARRPGRPRRCPRRSGNCHAGW